MKPIDYAKALAIGLALLAINVLVAILVVTAYALLIEPGHPQEFYNQAAQRIAPWCSHIAGTALFFAAGYFLSRRRPDRHGMLFATAWTVSYAVIDAASVGFTCLADTEFALSMLAKLLAALAGAYLAGRATVPKILDSNESN